MAKGYAKERIGVADGTVVPPKKADATYQMARHRSFRAVLDLSLASTAKAVADTNSLGIIPAGCRFVSCSIVTDTSLSTSTVSIGYAGAAAAFRALAVLTATDTITSSAPTAAKAADAFAADTEVLMTNAVATLPSAGIVVIEVTYAGR